MKNIHRIIVLLCLSFLSISSTSYHNVSKNHPLDNTEFLDGTFWIRWQIHSGFTASEEAIIKKALQILANRLTADRVRQNMYRILGNGGYNIAGGVWECSKLDNTWEYYKKYADLLGWQILQLAVKGEYQEFPKINIYPYHKKENVWAKAPLSIVTLTSIQQGKRFTTKGEFKVKLNRWMLGASIEGGKDPVFWASVLTHEMLHNLGHRHNPNPHGLWQINVFEKSLYWNGNYRTSSDCIDWYCGKW